MENVNESNRLVQLLYLRDRTLRRMRRSTDLHEVWSLYQEVKVLNLYIDLLEKPESARHA